MTDDVIIKKEIEIRVGDGQGYDLVLKTSSFIRSASLGCAKDDDTICWLDEDRITNLIEALKISYKDITGKEYDKPIP